MGLRVITGRGSAGKSGSLYEGVRADAQEGRQPTVLFPAAPDARRAAAEFAAQGLLGIRAVVFDRWFAELWGLWGDGRRLVDHVQRGALVERSIAQTPLSALSASARYPGLTHACAALARQVPEPEELLCRTRHDVEIREVLRAYHRTLGEHGLVEQAGAMRWLSMHPPAHVSPIYVNRFTDLTSSQEEFLVALSRHTRVWIALPWQADSVATVLLDGIVGRLAGQGEHVHIESGEPGDEIELLGEVLYKETDPLVATGAVRLGEAPDAAREVTLAADVIGEHIRAGTDPSRIVLTYRAAAARAGRVMTVFHEAGIPLYADLRVETASLPMVRALVALLDVVAGRDRSRERMAGYLRSAYSGIVPEQAARIDRRIRERRLSGEALLSAVEGLGGPAGRPIDLARRVCGGRTSPDGNGWKELADCLVANARTLGGELWEAESDAAAHAEILAVVNSLEWIPVPAGCTPVCQALEHGSVHLRIGDERGAVHFTEAHRVRATRYDVVVLGGMNADEFSSEKEPSWETGFLERAARGSETDERARERLVFHSLVTRARTSLVLLRSTGEGEGSETRASVFWNEVADRYRDPTADDPRLPEKAAAVSEPHSERPSLTSAIAHTPGRRKERGTGRAPNRPARAQALAGAVLERLRETEEFSVSEIETYLSCPYRWFFSAAVRPREIDGAFDLREQGSAAHEILARFYRHRLHEPGQGRVTADSLDEAFELLERVSDEVIAEYPGAQGTEEVCGVEAIRVRTRRIIEDDVRYLPGFEPCEVEARFGSRDGRPIEFGGVLLRGSIDRIDQTEGFVFVTDYKSGGTLTGHGGFASAGYVQLPVYARAAAQVVGKPPAGAVYRSLAKPKARGFWLPDIVDLCEWGTRTDPVDECGLDLLIEEAEERVSGAAARIRAGVIERAPSDAACRHCPASPVCTSRGVR